MPPAWLFAHPLRAAAARPSVRICRALKPHSPSVPVRPSGPSHPSHKKRRAPVTPARPLQARDIRPLGQLGPGRMPESTTVASYSLRRRGGSASSPPRPQAVQAPVLKGSVKKGHHPIAAADDHNNDPSHQAHPAKEVDSPQSESTLSPAGHSPTFRQVEAEDGSRAQTGANPDQSPLGVRAHKRPKPDFTGDSTETEVDDEDSDEYFDHSEPPKPRSSSKKKSPKQARTSPDHTPPTTNSSTRVPQTAQIVQIPQISSSNNHNRFQPPPNQIHLHSRACDGHPLRPMRQWRS